MKRKFGTMLLGLMLMASLALPVSAETYEPNITTQMTMKEIRSNPGIVASGIATYDHTDGGEGYLRKKYENETLEEYVGSAKADDCAKSLNMAIENYNNGVQVTWQLYSPEEIEANSELGMVQLYYYPAENPNANYVLLLGGNAGIDTGHLGEALASAYQLHEQGVAVFALRYRSFMDANDDAPMYDTLRALKFIDDHAEQFQVQRENYALLGYSSGGQIVGLVGSDDAKYGYKQLGVPVPAALLMAYPVNDFFEGKLAWSVLVDPGSMKLHYYWKNISDVVTSDYPPTYFWCGKNDSILFWLDWRRQAPKLEKALADAGAEYKVIYYDNADHAVGVGNGTDAEGWLTDAVAFWKEHMHE